jgi:uncharacterized GH25 family protein
MSNTIRFSLGVVDNQNQPLQNTPVICKSFNLNKQRGTCQSFTENTDARGKVNFEFESGQNSIEVDIFVEEYDINYAFQDGETVTVKLPKMYF